MASHEIAALQCPSCGSSNTGTTKPLGFGAEFTCAKCGGTSVLIINRALLPIDALQKSGDQVCAICGRVSDRKARFCQDGHKLVRTCLNRDCLMEFAAHHQRCDYCGWNQEVAPPKPGTPEAFQADLDKAIAKLADAVEQFSPDQDVLYALILMEVRKIHEACGRGKRAVPSIVALLKVSPIGSKTVVQACILLGTMGTDAAEALPILRQLANQTKDGWQYWNILAKIAPDEALEHCRDVIQASGKKLGEYGSPSLLQLTSALETAKVVGEPAIPMLLGFCGFLSGGRGVKCQETIDQIGKRKALVMAYPGPQKRSS